MNLAPKLGEILPSLDNPLALLYNINNTGVCILDTMSPLILEEDLNIFLHQIDLGYDKG